MIACRRDTRGSSSDSFPSSCSCRRTAAVIIFVLLPISKGMAQQVQLLGTLVHEPDLVVFDEPFSGLDALNQGKLEILFKEQNQAPDDDSTSIPATFLRVTVDR